MQRSWVLSSFTILIVLLGCAKFDDSKSQNGANQIGAGPERVTSQNLADFIRIEVQPTTKPEKYMVYFGWPQLSEAKRIRIRMEQTLAVVEPSQTTFSHEVNHNQTLTYTFDVLSTDTKIEKSFSKQVKVPRDFVVRDGQNQFTENTKLSVKRIYLGSTPLVTNGFNVELTADELISEKGIIQTFPDGIKAGPDQDGRSGGELSIVASVAAGTLRVYMRGENGGDGTKGPSYASRAADGSPAGNGTAECDCVGRMCMNQLSLPAQISNSDASPMAMVCTCSSYGSDAGRGATGAKGYKGQPARAGGDSGNFKISIKDGAGFDIQAFKISGIAGSPGEGGDGQPGGLGGAGRSDNRRDCRGNAGAGGATGPKGDPGDQGSDGKLGNLCIYIASEGKNDCY